MTTPRTCFVVVVSSLILSCSGRLTPPSPVEMASPSRPLRLERSKDTRPKPFRWTLPQIPPIRVIPVNLDGEPEPCLAERGTRPCDIEITKKGEVFVRLYGSTPVAWTGPGLSLRGEEGGVFSLDPNGRLVGPGLSSNPEVVRVMLCELSEEPVLRCRQEIPPEAEDRVWNKESCAESFAAEVAGGEIKIAFQSERDKPPRRVVRVEPLPVDNDMKALALFLFAMVVMEDDAAVHVPKDPE
jgi:hypothetical protein